MAKQAYPAPMAAPDPTASHRFFVRPYPLPRSPRPPPLPDGERLNSTSGRVERHVRLDDLVGVLHRLATLDLVDILHARRDLAPHRVLVVEKGRIVETDEELAVAGIRAG